MRRLGKGLFCLLAVTVAVLLAGVGYYQVTLPDRYTVTKGDMLHFDGPVTNSAPEELRSVVQVETAERYQSTLRLLHAVPIKQVAVTVVDAPVVQVCGTPFGIKLYTDGVLVVGLGDVATAAGLVGPASAAGIRVGDSILSIDGQPVATNEEVAACINRCAGRSVQLVVRRDGVEFTARLTPARPAEGTGYRAGMWVRDSSAGVGMLTFYEAGSGAFAGLGHAVSDVDTGEILPLATGEIVPAIIRGVERSTRGTPGELKGYFMPGSLGRLSVNGEEGLYGILSHRLSNAIAMPVAMKQEVQTGEAQILTTLEGEEPRLYAVEIEKVRLNAAKTRHMVIRITDEALLNATGGIVQGMSGSPIIQNGKLIGAVTHVLVDDPTRGYAIFAENMLETVRSVAQLKEAG